MGIVLERRIFLLRPQNSFLSLHDTSRHSVRFRADNVLGNHEHMTGCETPYFDQVLKCGVLPFNGSAEDMLALILAYNGEFYENMAVEDFDALRTRYEVFDGQDSKLCENASQIGRIFIGGPVKSSASRKDAMRDKQYLRYIVELQWMMGSNKFTSESVLRHIVKDLRSDNSKIQEVRRYMIDQGWPCDITDEEQKQIDAVMATYEPGELVYLTDEFLLLAGRQRDWARS